MFVRRPTFYLNLFAIASMLFFSRSALGDSITVGDKTYSDILVYEGGSFWYLKLPDEGKILNIPKSEVDASLVSISEDFEYRDALKRAI